MLQLGGADFEDAFNDLENSRYLVDGLGAGGIYGAVVATVFGWWHRFESRLPRARRVPAAAPVLILGRAVSRGVT